VSLGNIFRLMGQVRNKGGFKRTSSLRPLASCEELQDLRLGRAMLAGGSLARPLSEMARGSRMAPS
jgi:hypothetical protein